MGVFTFREYIAGLHGVLLGGSLLLAYPATMVLLMASWFDGLTAEGVQRVRSLLRATSLIYALAFWATVVCGTFVTYPWYRAAPPPGTVELRNHPRSLLLASPELEAWHRIGMEWKEHIAWIGLFLATGCVFTIWKSGGLLARNVHLRRTLMLLLTLSFATAVIAATIGVALNKLAPIR